MWLSTTRTLSRGRAAIGKELDRPPDPNRRFRLEIENISFLSADVDLSTRSTTTLHLNRSGHPQRALGRPQALNQCQAFPGSDLFFW